MRRWMKTAVTIAALASFTACGGDDSTGPSANVSFPDIDPQLLALFCVRGEATPGMAPSGSLTSSDCDSADFNPGDDSFFEMWRVRVAESGSVTFDAQSEFDNYLEVFRLDGISEDSVSVTLLGENDDRSPGNDLNALVSVTLSPGQDYFVAISGFTYQETGPYTIQIQ